jgi:vitamin K-dependent gamma-carboxylase
VPPKVTTTDLAAETRAAAEPAAVTRWLARAEAAALSPVDAAWLAAFRALFGLTMLVSMLRFIAYGWIDDFFVGPRFHFKYFGFEWVEPLSGAGMHGLFWALAGLSLCISVGLCFRAASALFFLGFAYLQLIDVATYLNHYYLAALLALLLAVSPAHRAYSADAALFGRRVSSVKAAWLYLFRVQVGVVYTFAGLAKAHADWLLDGQPLRIWLRSQSDFPVLGSLFSRGETYI